MCDNNHTNIKHRILQCYKFKVFPFSLKNYTQLNINIWQLYTLV